jgi:hypothetical protein
MKRAISNEEKELLKFNYEKLHNSIWENHKISWTVTAIFLTAIFGFQTFIIKDYFSATVKYPSQVYMAVLIIEGLVFIWLIIMQCFRSYNSIRFYRLRQIEDILSCSMICEGTYSLRQYKYDYRCSPKPLLKEIIEHCDESKVDEKTQKNKFDFFDIYKITFVIISTLNLILALAAYWSHSQSNLP